MPDQTAKSETAEAVEKVEAVVAEAPARAAEPAPAEVPAAVEASEPKPVAKAKRLARPAAANKIEKAVAAPAPKPARKVKKTASKPPRKPTATAAASAAATKPVRAGANKIKGANEMTNKTNGVDAGLFAAEQFKSVFGDVNERAKAAMERSAKVAEEIADLTRGNVEAFVASSKVAAKGVETLGQEAAEYSRKSFEEASAALKGFAEVKSATDFFKLQGDFARAAFDSAVAESARLSENMLKIAGDAAEPITTRYTVAAERVKTLAA